MAIVTSILPASASAADATTRPALAPHMANPILPGYYADPSIVQTDGRAYIYATLDPWGGRTLGCWQSTDFKNWTYAELNWPTKEACTSPKSKNAMVWAPSVVKGPGGKYYMAVSVGSEIWAGVADSPLGPWKNPLGDGRPWIGHDFKPGYHMIDAEFFIDTDGTPYLYWGSGFGWVNGKCFAVRLKPDMLTFDGDVIDVTPPSYFEAPFMIKHNGRYYLMYSAGKTIADTYRVHYAVGDSPFGPFKEDAAGPILSTNAGDDVISPGHHAVFERDGQAYILYHRHSVPFDPKFIGRQTCVDKLEFDADGRMKKVIPTHAGPPLVHGRTLAKPALEATFTASGQPDPLHAPASVGDDNYATRWAPATGATEATLTMDLGGVRDVARQEIRPEYAWKPYRVIVEASADGTQWKTVQDFTATPAVGSPIAIDAAVSARFLRLTFPKFQPKDLPSIIEWAAY